MKKYAEKSRNNGKLSTQRLNNCPNRGMDRVDEVRGCNEQLEPADAGADVNSRDLERAFINEDGELLFHSDGGAAAPDIPRQVLDLLKRNHFAAFVPAERGKSLEVDLRGARDHGHDDPAFVAAQDQCLVNGTDIRAKGQGDMGGAQIAFIDRVFLQFVADVQTVQYPGGIGLDRKSVV